ncbi:MAG: DMT family transporter [Casimicrobiaceae bacterium]
MPAALHPTGGKVAGSTIAHLALIVFAWGTNYPLMKLALRDIAPLTFSTLRLFGGAAVIALIAMLLGIRSLRPAPGEARRLAASGIFQYSGVLGFASLGLGFIPAGRTVVMVYSMPIWAALFASITGQDRVGARRWLGIVLGASGLALFVNPEVLGNSSILGAFLVLCAAWSWGIGVVVHRWRPLTTPFLVQAFFQLICSGVVLGFLALVFEHAAVTRWTPALVMILAWNCVIPTAVAVWSWSRVLQQLPAATAGQFLLATPLVGMATGSIMFGEAVPPIFIISAALVVAGSYFVLPRRPR